MKKQSEDNVFDAIEQAYITLINFIVEKMKKCYPIGSEFYLYSDCLEKLYHSYRRVKDENNTNSKL